jgi:DNA-directed RNA polymerase specialized sigma24 family protein
MSFDYREPASPEPGHSPRPPRNEPRRADPDFDSFRALHGPRLQGFALLVTLFDEPLADGLAAAALATAERQWTSLRHPERAAAWLRAHVVVAARRATIRPPTSPEHGADVMARMSVDPLVVEALATLSVLERAALVARDIEGLDERDCATVVGRGPASSARLTARARRRYLHRWSRQPADDRPRQSTSGIAARIARVAAKVTT